MIALDASAVVELLLRTERGQEIERRMERDGGPFHTVHLVDPEVIAALAKLVRLREIELAVAERAIEEFDDLPLRRHEHDALRARAWEIRTNVTAYDAMYVALAEALRCPLLTTDARLARSAAHDADVEPF